MTTKLTSSKASDGYLRYTGRKESGRHKKEVLQMAERGNLSGTCEGEDGYSPARL